MTKKQKKVLRRIIISAVLLVAMAVTFTVSDKTGWWILKSGVGYVAMWQRSWRTTVHISS